MENHGRKNLEERLKIFKEKIGDPMRVVIDKWLGQKECWSRNGNKHCEYCAYTVLEKGGEEK